MAKKLVSILIPCYNEEKSLPRLYEELARTVGPLAARYDFELFFVNDGSSDGTMQLIRQLRQRDDRVAYADLSRNFGKESAMLAGFDHVRGDCMVIMDADLQDPPALITQMLDCWEQGYQDVYARRTSRGRESWLRRTFTMAFYRILDSSTRFEVLQNVGDFRLLDRQCIDALRLMRESDRYTKGMFCWIGYQKKELLFDRGDRVAGQSNWSFWALFNLAIEGITSFTTAPLRFASVLGMIIAFVAFFFLLFYLVKTLIYGDPVQGFPTLVTIILFLGGIQLLCLGILGEYIGRIFNETKQRPNYLVRELVNSTTHDET